MKLTRKQRWGVLYWGIVALGESLAIFGGVLHNPWLVVLPLIATVVVCIALAVFMESRGIMK